MEEENGSEGVSQRVKSGTKGGISMHLYTEDLTKAVMIILGAAYTILGQSPTNDDESHEYGAAQTLALNPGHGSVAGLPTLIRRRRS